jgi:uncharacterized protein YjbI with pentapeptide repeats
LSKLDQQPPVVVRMSRKGGKGKKVDRMDTLQETMEGRTSGGFDYVNLAEVDEDLLCKICLKPLVNPVAGTCGHAYCEECIHEAIYGEEGECPACGVDLDKRELQPVAGIVKNLLGKIPVYCPNKSSGCTHVGHRIDLPKHVESCERTPCAGRADGCPVQSNPAVLAVHTETCQYVKVACQYDGAMIPRQHMARHLQQCPTAIKLKAQAEVKAEEERLAIARKKMKDLQNQLLSEVASELDKTLNLKPVHINCGGREFVTSLSTLASQPLSFLGVLATRLADTKEEQPIFFDRDGKMFEHILVFLRTGHIPMGLQRSELFALLQEARHFRLDELAARLAKTSFIGADMRGADLIGCKLDNVNFTNADLQHADLTGASLADTNLSRANLSTADLTSVNLSKVKLDMTKLCYANLSKAVLPFDLRGVDFTGVDLGGRDFSDMNLAGAIFTMANLRNVSLPNDLSGVNFTGCDLSGRDFSKSILRMTNFTSAKLNDASLPMDLTKVNFSRVDFTARDFGASNLTGASFANANLTKANLFGAVGFFPGSLTFTEVQIRRDHILEFNGFVALTRVIWNNKYADEDTAKEIVIQASDDEKNWEIVHKFIGEQTKDRQRERIRTARLSRYWRLRVSTTYGGKPAKTYLENFEFEGIRFSSNA